MNGLPWVRVDDILIHPRDNDLIIGTHGRSIWIIDDISPLQQLSETVMTAENHVFDVRPSVAYVTDTQKGISVEGARIFRGSNPEPGPAVSYMLKGAAAGDVTITVHDITGREIRSVTGPKTAGLHRVRLAGGGGGRGRGQGGGAAQVQTEGGQPPAAVPPAAVANQQQSGQQAAAQAAQQAAGRGGVPTPQINQAQQQQPAPQQAGRGGRGGGGGGAVPPGTYLVKVKVGDKVIGEKTVTIEADSTFMK